MKKLMLLAALLPILLSAFTASSCTPKSASLTNTSWRLKSYTKETASTSVLSGTKVTLKFNTDASQVSGSGGCNSYGGECRIKGSTISTSQIFHTEMACLDPPGIMEQENAFFVLLSRAQRFEVSNGELTIHCQDGQTLVFSKDISDPNSISLANTSWLLESYGEPDNTSMVLAGTKISMSFNANADQISGPAGCNLYGGKCRIQGNNITLSDIYQTKMYCIDPPGIMEQEAKYLELLGKSESFKVSNGELTFYCQDGQTLVFTSE